MIDDRKKRDPSPLAHLGPSGMVRRYSDAEALRKREMTVSGEPIIAPPLRIVGPPKLECSSAVEQGAVNACVTGSIPVSPAKKRGRSSSVEQQPSKLKERGSTPPVRSNPRGRPKTVADTEPWKAEGISRRTWFRRQKKEQPQ